MHRFSPWLTLSLLLSGLGCGYFCLQPAHIEPPYRRWVPDAVWSAAVSKVTAGVSDTIQIEQYRVSDERLADLVSIPLRQLHLERGQISDFGVEKLSQIQSLTAVRLRDCPLTDRGMQHLAACVGLDDINLPQAQCTDVGLQQLTRLPKLRYLRFSSPHVTERGLCQLAEIKTLRWLHLIRVPVTQEVLQQLATLPKLESLYVDDAPADDAAWDRFFKSRPDVHVHVNQSHLDRDPKRNHE
jgi:hypothetical protein